MVTKDLFLTENPLKKPIFLYKLTTKVKESRYLRIGIQASILLGTLDKEELWFKPWLVSTLFLDFVQMLR